MRLIREAVPTFSLSFSCFSVFSAPRLGVVGEVAAWVCFSLSSTGVEFVLTGVTCLSAATDVAPPVAGGGVETAAIVGPDVGVGALLLLGVVLLDDTGGKLLVGWFFSGVAG